MKLILSTIAAAMIATAALATPAEAGCLWDGYAWRCWQHPHHQYWGHYRDRDSRPYYHREHYRDHYRDHYRGW